MYFLIYSIKWSILWAWYHLYSKYKLFNNHWRNRNKKDAFNISNIYKDNDKEKHNVMEYLEYTACLDFHKRMTKGLKKKPFHETTMMIITKIKMVNIITILVV